MLWPNLSSALCKQWWIESAICPICRHTIVSSIFSIVKLWWPINATNRRLTERYSFWNCVVFVCLFFKWKKLVLRKFWVFFTVLNARVRWRETVRFTTVSSCHVFRFYFPTVFFRFFDFSALFRFAVCLSVRCLCRSLTDDDTNRTRFHFANRQTLCNIHH